ncbi:LYR motif-containing protein [Phanerochaete sordida]|uniref:LYR motif-containing protein n=1 Tax=Phanerochaete sordida TaxID=48140 RepID=A0A9P3GGT8_9APHY|nr:LYR motif-containing protein [Phanerochaete sordida]
MAAAPTKDALLSLYSTTLRTSRAFSSYNFREYFVRRTKAQFREIQEESDPAKLSAFYNERVKELQVLKRGALVNQLYGGWRLVVEKDIPKGKEEVMTRSDS